MTTSLRELPIERVKPDPDQPRRGKLIVDDLVKSIAEIGLVEPIVVRPIGDEYVVVAGHRRLAAMKKLGDWTTITALVVTDYDDMGALRDALAENTVRQPLSASDEADAMVRLSGLGMTDAEIAATFARDAKVVQAAKSIGAASEKGAQALADIKPAEGVQLSIEQAAAIAEFGGTSAGRQLAYEIESGSRYWRSTYESLVRKQKINDDAKEITKAHKGVKKVAAFAGTWEGPEKSIEPLVNLVDEKGKTLTTAGHKKCSGHAYSIEKPSAMYGAHGTKCTVTYWCTDWKANGHKVSTNPKRSWSQRGKAPSQTAEGPKQSTIDEELALDEAWEDATARRRLFIEEFLAKPKTGETWTTTALRIALEERIDTDNLPDEWTSLGLKALVPLIVRAYVLEVEGRWMDDWRWYPWNNRPTDLLNFLVANGHELSDVETKVVERVAKGVESQTRKGQYRAIEDPAEDDDED